MDRRVEGAGAQPGVRGKRGRARPLVLDADALLAGSDFATEWALAYAKPDPLRLLHVLWWLAGGGDHLRQRLAEVDAPEPDHLPLDEELVALARAAAEDGRPVCVVTSAGAFPGRELLGRLLPWASEILEFGGPGASAASRAEALAARFPDGFDHAGSAGAEGGSGEPVERTSPAEARSPAAGPPFRLKELAESLRPRQWAKNLLVFVPVVLAGQLADTGAVVNAFFAFAAVSVIASGTYLVNDIWDLPDDRRHWSKRTRPLASGRLSVPLAAGAAPVGIVAGLLLGAFVSAEAVAVLLGYLALSLAYTLALKRVPVLDGLVLAGLFTMRLGLGVVAAEVPPSPWLFVFSMFLFTSLVLAKRHAEIAGVISRWGERVNGRGYRSDDASFVLVLGVASGLGAVLIMVLYIVEDAFQRTFYGDTTWLWGFPPILFLFVCRIWLASLRGEMREDPVAFALRDRISLALAALLGLCFLFAWLNPL